MSEEKKGARLTYISNARVVGILLVVFGHSYPFGVEIPSVLEIIRSFIYSFHMPLFIFISAYLVTKTNSIEKYGKAVYIKKRAIRLLTPYIVLSVLCFVPKVLVSGYINDRVEFKGIYFLRALFVPRENVWGHFWFLPLAFIMAMISAGYQQVLKKNRGVAIGCCVVSFFLILAPRITNWFSLNDLKNNLMWYLLGMIAGATSFRVVCNKKKILAGISFAIAFIMFYAVQNLKATNDLARQAMVVVIAFTMIAGMMLAFAEMDFCKRTFFKVVEKRSFAIFVLSWPMQAAAEVVFNKICHWPVVVVMAIMFFVGVTGPLVMAEILVRMNKKLKKQWILTVFGI